MKTYVVTAHYGCSIEASSPEDAVKQAKESPLGIGVGLYEVESYDSDSGEYDSEIVKIFANGERKV